MSKTPKTYSRLTRNMAGLASYTSLWLAADHIMIVTSTGYTESYSRVLLRDVQAFFAVKTDRRLWWSLWWGAVTLGGGIAAGVVYSNDGAPVVSVILFGLGLAMLLVNELLGPSCGIYAVTGVQTVLMPALVRRKKAQRVLNRLRPLIEAAQADLTVTPPAAVVTSPTVAAELPVSAENATDPSAHQPDPGGA